MDIESARNIANNIFKVDLFEERGGVSAKVFAQRNLMGRTHYVDPDTLRFHKSRILRAGSTEDQSIFLLIESCALDFEGIKRGFRFVAFDLEGEVLCRPRLEDSFKTRERAEAAMWKWLEGFDAVKHYHDKLTSMILLQPVITANMEKCRDDLLKSK